MRQVSLVALSSLLGVIVIFGSARGKAETTEEFEKQLAASPTSLQAKEALAEAYLKECYLEKSLALWKEILADSPAHERARVVVNRLTAQELDLDSHLQVIETLLAKGITKGIDSMLDAAAQRAATGTQKANVLYLRGMLASRTGDVAAARADFEGVMKLYPDNTWAGYSAIAVADAERQARHPGEASRFLHWVIENEGLKDVTVKEEARYRLTLAESDNLTKQGKISALQKLLPTVTSDGVRREVLRELVAVLKSAHGRWTTEAIEMTETFLSTALPYEEAAYALRELLDAARTTQDAATLDRLLKLLSGIQLKDSALAREVMFTSVEALLGRAVVEEKAESLHEFITRAHQVLDTLSQSSASYTDSQRIYELRGRAYLVEAQKLIALKSQAQGLPVLRKARDHYLAGIPADPASSFASLERIGKLLEHIQEWETAVSLYEELAVRYPHLPQGRDALLRLGRLYEKHLDAPMNSLEAYAEYAARYPAELPYRQVELGERLRRLGYVNLLDFQKRNGLEPDGIYGGQTQKKLQEIEASFDMIRAQGTEARAILRGEYVHPAMYRIACRLQEAGRHHDAIIAYRMVVDLFPTKSEADDALIAIARLLGENLLFEEALGAYVELMEDYPEGNVTSEAYVEAAGCLENLGRWKDAEEYYDLYVKQFPQYKNVQLCKNRLGFLQEVKQYQDFVASNPQSPKLAEARYQTGTILYKKFKNNTKAASEFRKLADEHPQHVRAADALQTAGTALLWAEDFPGARKDFEELVKRYPDSRLADDAQYWIGHTYEYRARAIGKLDEQRIILKRRALRSREELLADLPLRRRYSPSAKAAPSLEEELSRADTLGVLASGSIRDRVNADLFQAISAYRSTVDKFKMGDMSGKALLRIGEIYTKYLNDMEKGVEAYRELLTNYPASPEAADAVHEVGNYLITKKKYEEAINLYKQFAYNYPTDPRVEDAMAAIARCYVETRAWDKALDAYESYINQFPRGKHADFARAQIEWIRMYYF